MGYEIDRDTLAKLQTLDDGTMRELILRFAMASGLNENKAQSIAGNSGFIKRKLSAMNPSDINRMLSSANPSAIASIMDLINSQKGGDQSGR